MFISPVLRLFFISFSLFIITACQSETASHSAQTQMPTVSTAEVLVESVHQWDEYTGRLQSPETVTLRPRVSGRIEKVSFVEGALVKAGDTLFVIDAKPFEIQVRQLQAEVVDAKSQVDLADRELIRGRELKAKNAISQESLDNREATYQQAQANLQASEAGLDNAKLALNYTQVKSPITGRVSNALITKGNYVSAGESQLTSIVSTEKVYAYFDADEQSFLRFTASTQSKEDNGQPSMVMMGLINEQGFPHSGTIDFIDNHVNASTGTIRIRAVFDNIGGRFTPGLFARIQLIAAHSEVKVLIDEKAIGTDLNSRFVLLLGEDNTLSYQKIILGKKMNGLRLIEQGLSAEDIIVVNGLQRVRPGAQVNANMVPMAKDKVLKGIKSKQARIFDAVKSNSLAAALITHADHG